MVAKNRSCLQLRFISRHKLDINQGMSRLLKSTIMGTSKKNSLVCFSAKKGPLKTGNITVWRLFFAMPASKICVTPKVLWHTHMKSTLLSARISQTWLCLSRRILPNSKKIGKKDRAYLKWVFTMHTMLWEVKTSHTKQKIWFRLCQCTTPGMESSTVFFLQQPAGNNSGRMVVQQHCRLNPVPQLDPSIIGTRSRVSLRPTSPFSTFAATFVTRPVGSRALVPLLVCMQLCTGIFEIRLRKNVTLPIVGRVLFAEVASIRYWKFENKSCPEIGSVLRFYHRMPARELYWR
mmetsp:Transcript_18231/g.37362  ORF Transcript_18231/g.37362 Transcript_18231/m.37362 type:complete len:291 (+) Transcript_18231:694-1566(+)